MNILIRIFIEIKLYWISIFYDIYSKILTYELVIYNFSSQNTTNSKHWPLLYRIATHYFSLFTLSFTLTLFFFEVQWLEKYIYTQYRRRWYLKYITNDKKTRVSIQDLLFTHMLSRTFTQEMEIYNNLIVMVYLLCHCYLTVFQ